ncbi:MAG: hypothetical protein FWG25_00385 [Promicromonosporaceae bacterium]|nr:hypothetical protein [Promicromonosporaceae bacterium]
MPPPGTGEVAGDSLTVGATIRRLSLSKLPKTAWVVEPVETTHAQNYRPAIITPRRARPLSDPGTTTMAQIHVRFVVYRQIVNGLVTLSYTSQVLPTTPTPIWHSSQESLVMSAPPQKGKADKTGV